MSDLPKKPGRLGDPNLTLRDDPRADPRMIAAMEQLGLLETAPLPISSLSGIEELLSFCDMAEEGYEMLNDTVTSSWPEAADVVRETEIINLLLSGHRNRQISTSLFISEKTVSSHRIRAFEKLGVKTTAELVRLAMRYNMWV